MFSASFQPSPFRQLVFASVVNRLVRSGGEDLIIVQERDSSNRLESVGAQMSPAGQGIGENKTKDRE